MIYNSSLYYTDFFINSRFGCCPNGITPATGLSFQGCYECVEGSGECDSCLETKYGCCADNITAASGPDFAGCEDNSMLNFKYCRHLKL